MAQTITTSVKTLVAKANAEVTTISVADALELFDKDDHVFIDLRDIREIQRSGKIPGAFSAHAVCLNFGLIPRAGITKVFSIRTRPMYFTVLQAGDRH